MPSVTSPAGLIHLGMDTSKNTIVVGVLLPGEEIPAVDRIFNDEAAIRRLIGRFPDRAMLRARYEAGPGGYDLYRLLASMGVACDVVAPSLIPKGGSDKGENRQAGLVPDGPAAPGRGADRHPGAVPGRGGGAGPGYGPRSFPIASAPGSG